MITSLRAGPVLNTGSIGCGALRAHQAVGVTSTDMVRHASGGGSHPTQGVFMLHLFIATLHIAAIATTRI